MTGSTAGGCTWLVVVREMRAGRSGSHGSRRRVCAVQLLRRVGGRQHRIVRRRHHSGGAPTAQQAGSVHGGGAVLSASHKRLLAISHADVHRAFRSCYRQPTADSSLHEVGIHCKTCVKSRINWPHRRWVLSCWAKPEACMYDGQAFMGDKVPAGSNRQRRSEWASQMSGVSQFGGCQCKHSLHRCWLAAGCAARGLPARRLDASRVEQRPRHPPAARWSAAGQLLRSAATREASRHHASAGCHGLPAFRHSVHIGGIAHVVNTLQRDLKRRRDDDRRGRARSHLGACLQMLLRQSCLLCRRRRHTLDMEADLQGSEWSDLRSFETPANRCW